MSGYKKRSKQNPALDDLLRRRVREQREARGMTREQLAAAARALGFDWNADHIAAIERGRARLEIADVLGLAHALKLDWADLVHLPDGYVQITASWGAGGERMPAVCRLEKRAVQFDTVTRAESAQLTAALEQIAAAQRAAELLSTRLGRTVELAELGAAGRKLWGHGVIEERDRRADRPGTPRQVQAYRAHAMRSVLEELEHALRR